MMIFLRGFTILLVFTHFDARKCWTAEVIDAKARSDDAGLGTPVEILNMPDDKEYYLELAGDSPPRRAAVLKWLEGSSSLEKMRQGYIALNANLIDGGFEEILCEDIEVRPEDLSNIVYFPEVIRFKFERSTISEGVLHIIQKHLTLEELYIHEDSKLGNAVCEAVADLPKLWCLSVQDSRIDDAGLQYLSAMQNLQSLYLNGNKNITAKGIQQIAKIPGLISLSIGEPGIDDAGLRHLSSAVNLKNLGFTSSRITSKGIEHLGSLTKLEGLTIESNGQLSDSGFQHFHSFNNLRSLCLYKTSVSDESVEVFSNISTLGRLHLDGSNVTNESVSLLRILTKLYDLSLRDTALDDSCVSYFETFTEKSISSLDIRGTNISREGAKRIRAALKESAVLKSDYGHLPSSDTLPN